MRSTLHAGALLCIVGTTAAAQDSTMACSGQRIDDIVVYSSAPTTAIFRRLGLSGIVSAIHTTTRPEVIRRFLLLNQGDACNELRRSESERILRAQPFIAEASVRMLKVDDQNVLEVRTTDEVALIVGVAATTASPQFRFARVGDSNINGEGIYVAGDWREGKGFRDGYGGKFVDNQLLGKPYTLTAEGHVTPLGSNWNIDAAHAFQTDIQRIAWRARIGADDDYAQFRATDTSTHSLRVRRNFFDAGGIIRLGPPGRLSLFGASISGDDERPGKIPVLISDNGFWPDTSSELLNRYRDHRIARINALWGIRDLGFARVTGFDALTGTQDLPVGFQLGTMFGRSLTVLGSRDDDIFMSGDLYIGAVGHNNALRVQVQSEGRRDNSLGAWDGLLTSGRAIEYFKLSPAHTSTLSAEFSGGWRQRVPFSLTLSDPNGGLRGFYGSDTPGGQRIVMRFDNRVFLARPWNAADIGVGAFADAGRLWHGDIPYGVTTPLRASVGVSLLGAVPIRSARIWRVDLAYALRPEEGGHRFEVRFTNTDRTTFFIAEPADIGSTREPTVPQSIFRWP
ncbi:MAG TPA: hypothetical protein VGM82_13950 [Gemmatimonadaceae bacterium]